MISLVLRIITSFSIIQLALSSVLLFFSCISNCVQFLCCEKLQSDIALSPVNVFLSLGNGIVANLCSRIRVYEGGTYESIVLSSSMNSSALESIRSTEHNIIRCAFVFRCAKVLLLMLLHASVQAFGTVVITKAICELSST